MFKLTDLGREKIKQFLNECKAKRKKILDAKKDTVSNTKLPTEKDILDDINESVDEDVYCESWPVTDHYSSEPLLLETPEGFVRITTKVCVTLEKTIRACEYFDATAEEIELIKNGENPFFARLEEICTEEFGEVEYDYAIVNDDTGVTMIDWN